MLSKRIKLIIGLIISINLILAIACANGVVKDQKKYIKTSYKLGTSERYGYTGVRITYDKEPVDFEIISPSGKRLSKDNCNIYDNDEKHKTILALVDSTEIGEWHLNMNQKSNINVTYSFITRASMVIHIEDMKIVDIDGDPYLSFIPIMSTEHGSTCKYTATMKSKAKSFLLKSGEVPLNKKAYVLIDPNKHAFDGSMYQIDLSCQSLYDDTSMDSASIQVYLSDIPEEKTPQETEEIDGDSDTTD